MEKSTGNKIYRAIGLMSGTAMDGIDVALIETDGQKHVKRVGFHSVPYAPALRDKIRSCLNNPTRNRDVERELTLAHVPLIQDLLGDHNLTASDIDVIGFHGQTTHHDPDNGITLQLGDGQLLANETGIDVVYDFRSADMKAGGQGAPFLPVYHRALAWRDALDFPIAIINIGGVSNITWISDDTMIAFDSGPGNAMIDDWMKSKTGADFDDQGQTAAKGTASQNHVDQFMTHAYFTLPYPKSLDRNDFNDVGVSALSIEDGAATLTAMTATAIAHELARCPSIPDHIYITGGGRHNTTLLNMISSLVKKDVQSVDTLNWNGDSMESEGFAYMAVRTLNNLPISFTTTTGCAQDTVGGIHVTTNPSKQDAA